MKKSKQIIAVVLSLMMLISVLGAFQGSSEEVKAAQAQGYLIDFAQYSGGNVTPGARLTAGNLKIGSEYTFSFSYYVDGVSTGTTVINAVKEWGIGSNVDLTENLSGKGTYTRTFTADHGNLMPVFQTHTPQGTPKLYVWDIKLVEMNTETNLFDGISAGSFEDDMPNAGLVTCTTFDPEPEEVKLPTYLIDYSKYEGTNENPNLMLAYNGLESGAGYTLSFKYYVEGESSQTSIINAMQAWGLGSNVQLDENLIGEGNCTKQFTADNSSVIIVFQTHAPVGKPKLYVSDIKLVKDGIKQNLLENINIDSFSGDMKDAGLVSVYKEEETTQPETTVKKYSIKVDGMEVAQVEEGQSYTLGDSANGYICGSDAYKPSIEVTVNEDMEFISIGEISIAAEQGAGIRYQGTAGIRFQAKVDAADAVLNSTALTTGMIVTANDIYESHDSVLNFDIIADKDEYTAINIVNNGWYNDVAGTYCGSIVNINKENYVRKFIAVAYATITYTDGTATTVYSNMTGVRSIKDVAQAVQAVEYSGIPEEYHSIIDSFASAK